MCVDGGSVRGVVGGDVRRRAVRARCRARTICAGLCVWMGWCGCVGVGAKDTQHERVWVKTVRCWLDMGAGLLGWGVGGRGRVTLIMI